MATIVPAILEDTVEQFEEKLSTILKIPEVKRIQVDFSDGKFTKRLTVQPGDIDVLNPAYQWEAHLMSENPGSYFFDLKLAGFNTVLFHYEAIKDKEAVKKLAGDLRELKISPGLAIQAKTPVEEIFPYLPLFDQIMLLTVDPGYQGEPFIESSYDTLQKLRNHDKNVIIEVDGAIKLGNAKRIAQLGADFLVVGSALFSHEPAAEENGAATPSENFEKFEVEIQNL